MSAADSGLRLLCTHQRMVDCTTATAGSWQGLGRQCFLVMPECSVGSAILQGGAANAGSGVLLLC